MIIPKHVALIPDGNRRWAKEKGLPTFQGHKKGLENIINLGRYLRKLGVKIFTAWGLSTENWQRKKTRSRFFNEPF